MADSFPNEAAILRLAGTMVMEKNDEWAVQRARHMTLETIAPLSDDPSVKLPAWLLDHTLAKLTGDHDGPAALPHHPGRDLGVISYVPGRPGSRSTIEQGVRWQQ